MGEQISHRDVMTATGSLRAVLAAIDAGELSCSAAYRNRLQGAVAALESLARSNQNERHCAAKVHRVDVDAQQLPHPAGDAFREAQCLIGPTPRQSSSRQTSTVISR
jgi:hypothetical protein